MKLEREFEDERIIRWRQVDPAEGSTPDPTVLDINLDTEEIYESRVYDVIPTRDPSGRLPSRETPALLRELLIRLSSVPDSGFKILAKRAKASGDVTFLLTMTNAGNRFLLARGDHVEEAEFRDFAADLENVLLASGVVNPPTVITADEWRQYEPPLA